MPDPQELSAENVSIDDAGDVGDVGFQDPGEQTPENKPDIAPDFDTLQAQLDEKSRELQQFQEQDAPLAGMMRELLNDSEFVSLVREHQARKQGSPTGELDVGEDSFGDEGGQSSTDPQLLSVLGKLTDKLQGLEARLDHMTFQRDNPGVNLQKYQGKMLEVWRKYPQMPLQDAYKLASHDDPDAPHIQKIVEAMKKQNPQGVESPARNEGTQAIKKKREVNTIFDALQTAAEIEGIDLDRVAWNGGD